MLQVFYPLSFDEEEILNAISLFFHLLFLEELLFLVDSSFIMNSYLCLGCGTDRFYFYFFKSKGFSSDVAKLQFFSLAHTSS